MRWGSLPKSMVRTVEYGRWVGVNSTRQAETPMCQRKRILQTPTHASHEETERVEARRSTHARCGKVDRGIARQHSTRSRAKRDTEKRAR